jgi:uncharacterized protein (TIGR03437 family)
VDGRLSNVNGAPAPKLPPGVACTVTIGGQTVSVNYCGEASSLTGGVLEVKAQVPDSISPAGAVPVVIKVGGVSGQPDVTLAVR